MGCGGFAAAASAHGRENRMRLWTVQEQKGRAPRAKAMSPASWVAEEWPSAPGKAAEPCAVAHSSAAPAFYCTVSVTGTEFTSEPEVPVTVTV